MFELCFSQLNCEELVEGYENPVAGVTRSADKGEDDGDDDGDDDDDTSHDAGTSTKKKKSKESASSKSISILSRTTSEFDTCAPEKAVDFDPVQGTEYIPSLLADIILHLLIAFYRYAMLLLRQSEGEQRLPNESQSNGDDHVRNETANLLQQKNHKHRRLEMNFLSIINAKSNILYF